LQRFSHGGTTFRSSFIVGGMAATKTWSWKDIGGGSRTFSPGNEGRLFLEVEPGPSSRFLSRVRSTPQLHVEWLRRPRKSTIVEERNRRTASSDKMKVPTADEFERLPLALRRKVRKLPFLSPLALHALVPQSHHSINYLGSWSRLEKHCSRPMKSVCPFTQTRFLHMP
jgi:hypothetical protein